MTIEKTFTKAEVIERLAKRYNKLAGETKYTNSIADLNGISVQQLGLRSAALVFEVTAEKFMQVVKIQQLLENKETLQKEIALMEEQYENPMNFDITDDLRDSIHDAIDDINNINRQIDKLNKQ